MATATAREREVRNAIRDLLDATGAFDGVYLYSLPEDQGRRAGDARAAVVQPVSWKTSLPWDDATEGSPLVETTTAVVVMVRDDDPAARDDTADMLASVVQNAVNGRSLGGLTFGQRTMVDSGVWLPEKPPERHVRLVVRAFYETGGWNEFDATE